MNMDFGFKGGESASVAQDKSTNLDTGNENNVDKGGEQVSELDKNNNQNNDTSTISITSTENNNSENNNNEEVVSEYEAGTVITIEDNQYTVDNKGNLVDKDGNIFKEAKDVKSFLEDFNISDEVDELNINNVIETVGVQITDENGKVVEFENTPAGISSYVNGVLELKQKEYAQAGVQSLLDKYPIVNDFLNYYIANGNSYEGFGQQKDRSGIVIDENNTSQQKAIIREAWKGSKRAGDVESYIKYLEDTNQLKDVAKTELEGLQENDKYVKEQLAKEAQETLLAQQKEQEEYWGMVKDIIDTKTIAGYKLPEVIILNKDGKKTSASLQDFYNYVYQVDNEGYSRYERSLMNKSVKERCERQLLEAYLDFTGNDYTSLINMAIADKEKKQLIARVNNKKSRITITKPNKEKSNVIDKIAENF